MIKRFLICGLILIQYVFIHACFQDALNTSLNNITKLGLSINLEEEKQKTQAMLQVEVSKNYECDYSQSALYLLNTVYGKVCFFGLNGAKDQDERNILLEVLVIARQILTEVIQKTEKENVIKNYAIMRFSNALHGQIAAFYIHYTSQMGVSPLSEAESEEEIFTQDSGVSGDLGSLKTQFDQFAAADKEALNSDQYYY